MWGKIFPCSSGENFTDGPELQEEEQPELLEATSLNALSGTTTSTIIKVIGFYGKRRLVILVDSGIIHNFVASDTATQVGCKIQVDIPLRVTVANGGHVTSYNLC